MAVAARLTAEPRATGKLKIVRAGHLPAPGRAITRAALPIVAEGTGLRALPTRVVKAAPAG